MSVESIEKILLCRLMVTIALQRAAKVKRKCVDDEERWEWVSAHDVAVAAQQVLLHNV